MWVCVCLYTSWLLDLALHRFWGCSSKRKGDYKPLKSPTSRNVAFTGWKPQQQSLGGGGAEGEWAALECWMRVSGCRACAPGHPVGPCETQDAGRGGPYIDCSITRVCVCGGGQTVADPEGSLNAHRTLSDANRSLNMMLIFCHDFLYSKGFSETWQCPWFWV